MTFLYELIEKINAFVWGPPMLIILGCTGLYLTIGLRFLTFRKIGYAFKLLLTNKQKNAHGDISPFKALMTALSATVGTGNIAGVATAISLGGPGAVFYMWLIALFGMATIFTEAVCAVTFREFDKNDHYVGGPMYYLTKGVGFKFPRVGKILGILFAIFGACAAFGIGNAVQTNSIADVLAANYKIPTYITAVVIAAFVGFVILGGIKRIGEIAGKLVPTMIFLYVFGALAVIFINIAEVPAAFHLIFSSAFNPTAATGGFAGATVAAAIRFGVARGIFSNEAGLGSTAIAHAAAATSSPIRQGHIAMLGTFIDTIIVCTMTALCIITSGVWDSGVSGSPLTSLAFGTTIIGGSNIVALALILFAFTTTLGWSYYGERCWQYLFGLRFIRIYRILWIISILFFAVVRTDFVWELADMLNGMMAIPNIIGLLILSPVVFKASKKYWRNNRLNKTGIS